MRAYQRTMQPKPERPRPRIGILTFYHALPPHPVFVLSKQCYAAKHGYKLQANVYGFS